MKDLSKINNANDSELCTIETNPRHACFETTYIGEETIKYNEISNYTRTKK